MLEEKHAERLLYDDYFSDPGDKGVEVTILHKGKLLPFRIKKSVTLDEKQMATDAAVSITLDASGMPSLSRMDQGAYTKEIVLAALKSWPFVYGDGTPVKITRKTVSSLDGGLAEKIANVALGQTQAQEKAADPFEMKSEED